MTNLVSIVFESEGTLTQAIRLPVILSYFSISWESFVKPSLEVNKISVPSTLPTKPPLPVPFNEGSVTLTNTGKLVRAVEPETLVRSIVNCFLLVQVPPVEYQGSNPDFVNIFPLLS